MEQYRCDACEKSFNSVDALAMHNKSKHPNQYKKPLFTTHQKKRLRNYTIIAIVLGLMILGITELTSKKSSSSSLNFILPSEKAEQIPAGAVHWHPILEIIVDGKQIILPPNIGSGTGKIVDTHLSEMRMSPTHTHESDGTIHLENNNPRSKPETVTLGYFFYVWDKTFNSTCIFEYCTDKGVLTLMVNGQENTEFENYIMRDKDKIKIEYESFRGEPQQ